MFMNPQADAAVNPAAIRGALGRILTTAKFRACPQLTSFLRFVVETTLAGRGNRLKGYTIGVEAFGRPDSFDPQIDPIVRVEAVRLRRALALYYGDEGAADPVLILLPRGRYVPVFSRRSADVPPPGWVRAARTVQRILRARLVLRIPGQHR
jgi:hypothetical protein